MLISAENNDEDGVSDCMSTSHVDLNAGDHITSVPNESQTDLDLTVTTGQGDVVKPVRDRTTGIDIEGVFGFTEEDVYADCDNASVHRDSWSREHGHRQMGVTMTKSPLPPHRRNGSKAQNFRQLIPFRMDPTKSNHSTSARNEYCIWRHKVATFSFPLHPLFSLNISRPFVPTKNGPKFITSSEQPGPVIVDVSDEIDQVRQGTHTAPLLQGRVAKVVTINQNLSF